MNRRAFVKALLGATAAATVLSKVEWLADAQLPRWARSAAAEALTLGDVFSIQGVYAVNPVTYQVTEHLQKFVITADVTNDDSEPSMWPHVITTGPYQTVNALPSDDAELVIQSRGLSIPTHVEWSANVID